MSECRWCDECDSPFSAIDEHARRINIEEPEVVNGVRRGIVTVQRDNCGRCMRKREARRRAVDAERAELLAAPTIAE